MTRWTEVQQTATFSLPEKADATPSSQRVASQVAVLASPDHEQFLASSEPRLAANKRLVYDFYREVFEGGHMALAGKYLAESYIQHNPTAPTGRAGFVQLFSTFAKPNPFKPE